MDISTILVCQAYLLNPHPTHLQSRKHTQETNPAKKTAIRVKMKGMYQSLDVYVLIAVYTMVRPFLCWEILFQSKQSINLYFQRVPVYT